MLQNKRKILKILLILFVAAAFTLAAGTGALTGIDNTVSDALYQHPEAQTGEIVVIGIDQRALEDIGPLPWSRDVMAEVIRTLNADSKCRPAVIGVDVLYAGESSEEADEKLTEAAGEWGNVVLAAAVGFGSELVIEESGDFYLDDSAVQSFDEPFPKLKAVTESGHINTMFDADGIIRHMILNITAGEDEIPSFARVIYEKYADTVKIEKKPTPVTKENFWYLDYAAKPGGFYDGVSVSDLLTGQVSSEYYAGKIVLIGPYAAGMQDAYTTAIDHASLMYGVEIQANAISAMLQGRYKSEVPKGTQLSILFLITAFALWWFTDRKLLPATVFSVIAAGGAVTVCMVMYQKGMILHALWIPLAIVVLYIGTVAINYVHAAMEKRRITNTFKRYVDPSIIRELLKTDSDALGLGGKLTDIAVLFVDIRGFTTMSEMLNAKQVVEILNRYLTLTTECIMRNHGTLDKFVGDCTMAMWNAPLQQEDYVYHACKAAMDMVEGAKPLAEELQKEFGRSVSFGVGVHCGPAVVGNIGASMRMDFTAIGDTVNTAARLEANAPGGTVYISRAVADALGERGRVTSLGGEIQLKGKTEGFEVLILNQLI